MQWSQQFREVVWLDSNTYQQTYSSYDAVLAVDAFTILQTDASEAFDKLTAKVLVISVDTDRLFLPKQQKEIYDELHILNKDVTYIEHKSKFGHDTFLIETEKMGSYIQSFINE